MSNNETFDNSTYLDNMLEYEKLVLSYLIKDIEIIKYVLERGIQASWFLNDDLRALFVKIIETYNKHNSILTKKHYLDLIKVKLGEIGKTDFDIFQYEEFYDELYSIEYDFEYFKVKFNEWRLKIIERESINIIKNFIQLKSAGTPIDKIISKISNDFLDLKGSLEEQDKRYRKFSLKTDIHKALQDFVKRHENREMFCGYETGFRDLDAKFSGIEKGKLHIIMGLSSSGKTTLARCIVRNIQKKYNAKVCVISCEESGIDFLKKIICAELRIPYTMANKGLLSKEEIDLMHKKINDIIKSFETEGCIEIIEIDARKYTIQEIELIINREYGEGYFDVVVLDHLSLVKAYNNKNIKEEHHIELGDIAKFFRDMAKRYNFAAILIAQANRSSIKQLKQKREVDIYLENIEGSNKPGQDSDKAIAIKIKSDDPSIAILKVVKDRDGERDYEVRLKASLEYCLLEDMPQEDEVMSQDKFIEEIKCFDPDKLEYPNNDEDSNDDDLSVIDINNIDINNILKH